MDKRPVIICLALAVLQTHASAQFNDPRTYQNAPVGINQLELAYAYVRSKYFDCRLPKLAKLIHLRIRESSRPQKRPISHWLCREVRLHLGKGLQIKQTQPLVDP